MKTRIISIVLVIGTGIAFPCFSQSVGLYANRKNILISNPDPSHSTTVTVYWRNRLKSKTTLRPNQREYVVTKTITSPRDIKKVRYQFDYDEDAFELDQTIRHEKMKEYLDMRNEGALNQCYNRMKLDAFLRVMFGVFLGDTGKKIISISDAFRLNVGQPHTFDRVESDLRLLASEESEFMKSLEWAIDQFNINNKADPFNYCPNLESDIKRYNRLYLKLKFDTSIEEHYNQIKISNLTSKKFPISNQISKENRKSLRSVQPATFFDASFFLGATGIGGEFKLGYSPFKTKYFRKENRSGKIFITAGVGKYIGKFSPTEITSFTNSTKDVHYVLPKHSAKNSALARSDSDYGMLGLKASFSRNLWTFGMEGGVTYNYQNTIYVTSNEYYNIIADELVNVKSDKTEKFNLYEYTPQFDLDKLKPYWNLDIKVNLAEDKKSHPLRGSMYVGCTLSMRHFISELYKDLTIEQITSQKNKITAYQQKKWSEIPGGGGLRIGMNF